MPRTPPRRSAFVLFVIASGAGLAGCPGVIVDESSGGTTTTGDTTSTTTGDTTSTTTTGDTTTTTSGVTTTPTLTTGTPCACATPEDCGPNATCFECTCIPNEGCPGSPDCICQPGAAVSCYSGPPGTEGIGLCIGGIQQCVDGLSWGPCEGEILPQPEACNGLDDDCDGVIDLPDLDGDGWSPCEGDCCEDVSCATHPEKVNPGAIEYPGDQLDNDCNPATLDSDAFMTCSDAAYFGPASAIELLKAMDLCQFTVESPPLAQKTWGVISASLTLADGSAAPPPNDLQVGVLTQYGPNVPPKYGTTMAAISTGTARAEGDPGFVYPQNGPAPGQSGNFDAQTSAGIPADYLAAHGGAVPTNCGVCNLPGCATAYDSVNLKVRLRVPTNVTGFTYDFNFYTAEYPENVCSQYDDFFVALLDAQQPLPMNPADKNTAVIIPPVPVSVSTVPFASGVCLGCSGGSLGLVGTGMGGWDGALNDGGSTGWQRWGGYVTPGDTIELRFIVWDAWDGNVDSLVLLDRFRFGGPPMLPSPD